MRSGENRGYDELVEDCAIGGDIEIHKTFYNVATRFLTFDEQQARLAAAAGLRVITHSSLSNKKS